MEREVSDSTTLVIGTYIGDNVMSIREFWRQKGPPTSQDLGGFEASLSAFDAQNAFFHPLFPQKWPCFTHINTSRPN
jgi:hypothetical protein